MSYCVNCGVELDPSAKTCPLCGTPAWHPELDAPPYFPAMFRMVLLAPSPSDRAKRS